MNLADVKPKVVVAIPCYNEALTIAKVVADFRRVLPEAEIHVFDNNSSDDSVELARAAGAHVQRVPKQGKGYVCQMIFERLYADALIMVDGDDTYHAEDAPRLLEPVLNGEADMVVGNRLQAASDESMVRLHQFGNRLIVGTINKMFGTAYIDILSGYRVFGPRFLENVPVLTSGFEIETEMTLQALEAGLAVIELPVSYRSRPQGSQSKLRTWSDGYRIMLTAAILLRDHRPLVVFGLVSALCWLGAGAAAALRVLNYLAITAYPDSLLTGLILLLVPLGGISFAVGLILNAVNTRFQEMKQIMQRNKKSS
jgi:glycosyltransferase involved in cell wall biosynthesis